MSNQKKASYINFLIFLLVVIATIWMLTSISGPLSDNSPRMLKFFTVDSNILMGIIALIVGLNERLKNEISKSMYILKLVGTSSVALTMLVTVFYLTPTTTSIYGILGMYHKSNFLYHLAIPILSILVFILYERTNKIKPKEIFWGLVPISIYSIYYVYETLTHINNGVIQKGYDWYGFFIFGVRSVIIVLPIILIISYIINYVLWKINKRKEK